jgi:hypothetical protein
VIAMAHNLDLLSQESQNNKLNEYLKHLLVTKLIQKRTETLFIRFNSNNKVLKTTFCHNFKNAIFSALETDLKIF